MSEAKTKAIRSDESGPVWCSACAVGRHQDCGIVTPVVLGRECACEVVGHGVTEGEIG